MDKLFQLLESGCPLNAASLNPFLHNKSLEIFVPSLVMISEDIACELSHLEKVDIIRNYLEVDYPLLQTQLQEELRIKEKIKASSSSSSSSSSPSSSSPTSIEGSLVAQVIGNGLGSQFERSDYQMRCRLFLSEFFNVLDHSLHHHQGAGLYSSDLFGSQAYLEELACLLVALQRSLPEVISLEDLVRVCLRLEIGTQLLIHFVANTPEVFQTVAKAVVGQFRGLPDLVKRNVGEALINLSQLGPHHSIFIRGLLMKEQILPQVMLHLTLHHCNDEVYFVSLLFEASPDWLDSDPSIRSLVQTIRRKIVTGAQNQLGLARSEARTRARIDECVLMRLYCGFIGYLHLPVDNEELEIFLYLMESSPNPRVIKIGLCFLLLCPGLKELIGKNEIVNTLLRVKERALRETSESGADSEMLLLLAIYFHTQQPLSKITGLVVDTLNINLKLNEKTVTEIKEIFTKEVFQEKILAEFVISLPPTRNLLSTTRSVPVTCVFGLLQGRIFQNHGLDVRSWITKQIFETGDTVHPLMPALLQEYVGSMVVEGNQKISRIPEDTITRAFSPSRPEASVPQTLLAFYVLAFNSSVQSQRMKNLSVSIAEYSPEVLDAIPFKKITRQIEKSDAFVNIYPLLLSLTATQLPHLFGALASLKEEEHEHEGTKSTGLEKSFRDAQLMWQLANISDGNPWPPSPATIEGLLIQSIENPPLGLMVFEWLKTRKPHELEGYCEPILSACFPLLLSPEVEPRIVSTFKNCWEILSNMIPQQLWTAAVNALVPNTGESEETRLVHIDLVNDPLIVLRCDPAIFRCPPLYSILIEIIRAYMVASKQKLNVDHRPTILLNREDLTALLFAQDALVVQMIIETCSEDVIKIQNVRGVVEEIRMIACNFLHQLFIESPVLMKLVHFQGYKRDLIPIIVNGVPSMHICLEFLPELLGQNSLEKQIFAVWLAASVMEKYPLPKSLELAGTIITKFKTSVQRKDPKEFLEESLPALVTICSAFPHLSEDACDILVELRSKPNSPHPKNPELDQLIDSVFQRLISEVVMKGSSSTHLR